MSRILMLVAIAAVAGAMYAAGASGSQQTRFARESQVVTLQKKLATATKELTAVKKEADAAVAIIGTCYLKTSGSTASIAALPVSQFGGPTAGFLFGANATSSTPRTALDVVSSSPQDYLQNVAPACVTGTALRHSAARSGMSRLQRWVEHTR
jgi:hypothetical protein